MKSNDKIRGCLFGGAVGDALGYTVEFLGESEIFFRFGRGGIQQYQLDETSGKALISDDTQMTLFTANGLLVGDTRKAMNGGAGEHPRQYVSKAYQDWLRTQRITFEMSRDYTGDCISWLADVPELYSRRAPGTTCMSGLIGLKDRKDYIDDYIEDCRNGSKGCGGVMRIAPVALNYHGTDIKELDYEGAQIAAITHGHSLGYMPAAVLVHIINRIVFPEKPQSLKEIILEAKDTVYEIFADDAYTNKLSDIIDLAVSLSENTESDLCNINRIGEGWIAEEALGIAIYCSLRHQDDFSAGVIAAVNHKGDSDSTGAVTGNILGALLGYEAIEAKWKTNLEIADVILEIADDISQGCQISPDGRCEDSDWTRKYIGMRWKEEYSKTEFVILKGDITKDHGVLAIVNAANRTLLGGGGVDGAIHYAAGPELLEECRCLGGCETGKAKITKAYKLPCEYVIHTPGPIWRGGSSKECDLLESCYRSCLELAVKNGIRSIAFPSISTGVYGFPVDEAAKIAIRTAKNFVAEHAGKLDIIKWVLFDDRTFSAYESELKQ